MPAAKMPNVRLERDCAVIVFDENYPEGCLCGNGSWAKLFNEEEANEFVSEYSEYHPNSQYRIFKLIEIGLL